MKPSSWVLIILRNKSNFRKYSKIVQNVSENMRIFDAESKSPQMTEGKNSSSSKLSFWLFNLREAIIASLRSK